MNGETDAGWACHRNTQARRLRNHWLIACPSRKLAMLSGGRPVGTPAIGGDANARRPAAKCHNSGSWGRPVESRWGADVGNV